MGKRNVNYKTKKGKLMKGRSNLRKGQLLFLSKAEIPTLPFWPKTSRFRRVFFGRPFPINILPVFETLLSQRKIMVFFVQSVFLVWFFAVFQWLLSQRQIVLTCAYLSRDLNWVKQQTYVLVVYVAWPKRKSPCLTIVSLENAIIALIKRVFHGINYC